MPHLVAPADSLLLAEHDEVYIGDPFSLVVVPEEGSGALDEIWVSDIFANVLWHFDGDGRYVKRVGRPGPGPAEFRSVRLMFLTPTGEVAGADAQQRAVKWFDRGNGAHQRVDQFNTGRLGWSPPTQLGTDGIRLAFPLLDITTGTSIGILDQASGEWTRTGVIPERHRTAMDRGAGWFPSYFTYVSLAPLGDAAAIIAFGGDDTLFRHDFSAGRSSELGLVPRRFRRGVDHPCIDLADHEFVAADCGRPFDLFSSLMGLWSLPDGRLVAVNVDQHSSGQPPAILLTGQTYLTILDPSTDTACVDLHIPGGTDARAVFTMVDGDLYVLDRKLKGEMSEGWLLRVPIPSMEACPARHRVEGWRSSF